MTDKMAWTICRLCGASRYSEDTEHWHCDRCLRGILAQDEIGELIERVRRMAEWDADNFGDTIRLSLEREVVTALEAQRAENEGLRHDIADHVSTAGDLATENARLRAACQVTLAELVEDDEGVEIGNLDRILSVNRAALAEPDS